MPPKYYQVKSSGRGEVIAPEVLPTAHSPLITSVFGEKGGAWRLGAGGDARKVRGAGRHPRVTVVTVDAAVHLQGARGGLRCVALALL